MHLFYLPPICNGFRECKIVDACNILVTYFLQIKQCFYETICFCDGSLGNAEEADERRHWFDLILNSRRR